MYEWVHVFECLLRSGRLEAVDARSMLFRSPHAAEHRWSDLARQRLRLDYRRIMEPGAELDSEYRELLEAYDCAGLPYERAVTRLSYARWLLRHGGDAPAVNRVTLALSRQYAMRVVEADAWELATDIARLRESLPDVAAADAAAGSLRSATGFRGARRP
jgi:hypothetical protein